MTCYIIIKDLLFVCSLLFAISTNIIWDIYWNSMVHAEQQLAITGVVAVHQNSDYFIQYSTVSHVVVNQSQNHIGCENLPSLHVWWVRRQKILRKSCYRFRKNGFVTSQMTSQPLNGHTQWKNIFFPLIDVIHFVSEHLIGPLEEPKVSIFPLQNSNV